ncbi:alpha/beta fold hydrolase [Kribbella solani]|uniref:dienelactone hydrolase family protein n=1 Tax=Kribbella solani TaxID=236067 RepID=UPI0029BE7183|nr:alpha/beta fold hydrolase [Kribbella solani]MDX2972407.1 alpha/beta fold hydrolase [Kribbella solani]MDX3007010.1 alpha/beta fold hydrolase [Kribbella solani]
MGVTVTVGQQDAYLARVGRAGMLLLPMITGIGEQVREWADELAGEGITALVWDPFKGRSTDNATREELSGMLREMDDDTALAEQQELLDYLVDELGCSKVGVIGWCLGGRFAFLLAARDQRVSNVVAFHPTVPSRLPAHHTYDAIAEAAGITAPVLVSYPGADAAVPNADFETLQTVLQARTIGATFTQFFPGADHGFSDKSRHGKDVNADAYRLAWPQALAFMKSTVA